MQFIKQFNYELISVLAILTVVFLRVWGVL